MREVHLRQAIRSHSGWALLVSLILLAAMFFAFRLAFASRPGLEGRPLALAAAEQVTPGRVGASLAYDPHLRGVLLFGGTLQVPGGRISNQTWLWTGQSWQQLHPTSSPPALAGNLVYDAASQQMLLLLYQVSSSGTVTNQLWNWTGSTWQHLHPSELPEVLGASLVYDAAHGQVVLFGGGTPGGHLVVPVNATWIWQGSTWQRRESASVPPARLATVLAYDPALTRVVLFGGLTAAGLVSDTWTWDGTNWQQLRPAGQPSARQVPLLIADDATGQFLLFGGLAPFGNQPAPGNTLDLRNGSWIQISATGAPTGPYLNATYDPASRSLLVYTAVKGTSQTWIWNGSTWKKLS